MASSKDNANEGTTRLSYTGSASAYPMRQEYYSILCRNWQDMGKNPSVTGFARATSLSQGRLLLRIIRPPCERGLASPQAMTGGFRKKINPPCGGLTNAGKRV